MRREHDHKTINELIKVIHCDSVKRQIVSYSKQMPMLYLTQRGVSGITLGLGVELRCALM